MPIQPRRRPSETVVDPAESTEQFPSTTEPTQSTEPLREAYRDESPVGEGPYEHNTLANAYMNEYIHSGVTEYVDDAHMRPTDDNPESPVLMSFVEHDDHAGLDVVVNDDIIGSIDYRDDDDTAQLIAMTREYVKQ